MGSRKPAVDPVRSPSCCVSSLGRSGVGAHDLRRDCRGRQLSSPKRAAPDHPPEFWGPHRPASGPTWVRPLLIPVPRRDATIILTPPGGLPIQGCAVGCRLCRGRG